MWGKIWKQIISYCNPEKIWINFPLTSWLKKKKKQMNDIIPAHFP